jgi:hypothetical protein
MIDLYLERIRKVLWALLMLAIPVTNFPYFPTGLIGRGTNVRPLLIYPLIGLLILVTLPRIWTRRLPIVWLPFFVFVLFLMLATSFPLLLGEPSPFQEIQIQSRSLRAMITLLIAGAIYLTISLSAVNQSELDFILRWLFVGLMFSLVWGTLQIISVLDLIPGWYVSISKVQKHITMNVGSPDRIMGLTLEPSWFADQISALWLPWVLPAFLLDRTVFKKRWGWLTVEKILLPWMLLVLIFTLSRAGFAVAGAVLFVGFLFFRKKWLHHGEEQSNGLLAKISAAYRNITPWIRTPLTILVVVLILAGISYFASTQSNYISRMWKYWLNTSAEAKAETNKTLSGYFRFIGFGPRFVYWETAFRTFLSNPLAGVGLGNFSTHFLKNLPPVHLGYMPELLTRIVPDYSRIVTPKNYFARLLAETGILGISAFITFLGTLATGGSYLWLSKNRDQKYWGAAALLGLFAFLVDSFSYDSLAIPNPWVVFGLITAAMQVYLVNDNQREKLGE